MAENELCSDVRHRQARKAGTLTDLYSWDVSWTGAAHAFQSKSIGLDRGVIRSQDDHLSLNVLF